MKALFVAFVALLGFNVAANAQCATGYTQLSGVFACQASSGGSWTPASLTAGELELWFDANNAASLSLTGTTVNSWTDRANSVVMSPVSGGATITYTASLLNSMPGITFSTNSNELRGTTAHGSFGNPVSIFAVATYTTANYSILYAGYSASGNLPAFGWDNSTPAPLAVVSPGCCVNDSSTTIPISTPEILEYIMPGMSSGSSGAAVTYLNGTVGGTIAAMSAFTVAGNQTGVSIGNKPGNNSFEGNVHEIVILNTQATTTDRQLVEGYLAWKWGLQANLPSGHPYKSAAP